ncbi:MAG TPA: hypothetical protein DEP60_06885 [Ruminococcaceae bacterium]|jgi:hypothetical protein|nr:hypothetical protein [Oscillospiraceae bacterium]
MDQIAAYLEKLGYEVEDQGKIKRFLLVLKDGLPIGFILSDFTVKMIAGEEAQKASELNKIVAFVKANQHSETAGHNSAEYIMVTYRGNQLTTFYDLEAEKSRYAIYIIDKNGEVSDTPPLFDSYKAAMHEFILQTGMIDLKAVFKKEPFRIRWRRKLINRLMKKLS